MGGDGGVIATNRRYMRGAGTADTTGDSSGAGAASTAADVKANQQREALESMTTCAISKVKLRPSDAIVACRFGRLYLKEAAVQALLRRKTGQAGSSREEEEALAHVKRLSDFYPVRGNTSLSEMGSIVWTCPITNKTLNGSVPPAILLVPGNVENSNVVSEFAFKQLSEEDMSNEYGPIERKIRLAPTPEQLAEVQAQLEQERSEKKSKKDKTGKNNHKHGTGKRKRSDAPLPAEEKKEDFSSSNKQPRVVSNNINNNTVGSAIRSRVDSALQSNQVLSSIFTEKQPERRTISSEKNRKDNLFAR